MSIAVRSEGSPIEVDVRLRLHSVNYRYLDSNLVLEGFKRDPETKRRMVDRQ